MDSKVEVIDTSIPEDEIDESIEKLEKVYAILDKCYEKDGWVGAYQVKNADKVLEEIAKVLGYTNKK